MLPYCQHPCCGAVQKTGQLYTDSQTAVQPPEPPVEPAPAGGQRMYSSVVSGPGTFGRDIDASDS